MQDFVGGCWIVVLVFHCFCHSHSVTLHFLIWQFTFYKWKLTVQYGAADLQYLLTKKSFVFISCNFTQPILWPFVFSPALDNKAASHCWGGVKTLVSEMHKSILTLWLSEQCCCRLQYFGLGVLCQLVTSHQHSEGSYCHYLQGPAVQNTCKNGDCYWTAEGTMILPNISTYLPVTVAQQVRRHNIITFYDILNLCGCKNDDYDLSSFWHFVIW